MTIAPTKQLPGIIGWVVLLEVVFVGSPFALAMVLGLDDDGHVRISLPKDSAGLPFRGQVCHLHILHSSLGV